MSIVNGHSVSYLANSIFRLDRTLHRKRIGRIIYQDDKEQSKPKKSYRLFIFLLFTALPQTISAQTTPKLRNVTFGTVSSVSFDLTDQQNVCSYTGLTATRYSVTATGSGVGSAFTLNSGTATAPYEVQWAQTANAPTGTNLTASTPLNGQQNGALLSGVGCALGGTDATLIVIVRAGSLQRATMGTYSGSLTVILAAQ